MSDKVIKKVIEIIGQEEWNDLHNENSDICTTMSEIIITLKSIPDIEKENAELKEKLGDVQMQKAGEKSDLVWKLKTANEQKAERLTKAKELLNMFLRLHYNPIVDEHTLFCKVEQFLKDSEVPSKFEEEVEE